jgi:hypothetical protein
MSVPAAGDVAPGAINWMSKNDGFMIGASKRADIDPNGQLDIVAHGTDTHVQVDILMLIRPQASWRSLRSGLRQGHL